MKTHTTLIIFLIGIMLPTIGMSQSTGLSKEQIIAIHDSFIVAFEQRDFSVYEKYLYADSQIYMDMDPAKDNELVKIELDDFKKIAAMSLQMAEQIDIADELLSVEINTEKNQATVVSKSTVSMSILGTNITEISKGTTVYGLVDGEIKIKSISDEMISSTTH